MPNLAGYRTIIIGLLMAIAPAALSYLSGVDWAHYFGPNVAFAVAGVITIVMRMVTTTPVGTAPAAPSQKLTSQDVKDAMAKKQ